MRYVTMSVKSGWWNVNILGTELTCSYLYESFPFELLDAIAAWTRGEAYSLDFNGENIGHVLYIAPGAIKGSRVIISEFNDYDGAFSFPVDRQMAGLQIIPQDRPGSFSVQWEEDSAKKPAPPNGTYLLDRLLPTTSPITQMIEAIEDNIEEAGSTTKLLSEWYCLSDDETEETLEDRQLVEKSVERFEVAFARLREVRADSDTD